MRLCGAENILDLKKSLDIFFPRKYLKYVGEIWYKIVKHCWFIRVFSLIIPREIFLCVYAKCRFQYLSHFF